MIALTCGLVVCSGISCWIAVKGIQATRRLEEEKSRPYVVFEAYDSVPFFGIKMENVGYTPAYNVTVTSDPPFRLFGVSDEKMKKHEIQFMNSTMPYLAPRGKFMTDLGNLDSMRKENPSLRFKVTVSYEDAHRVKYNDEVWIDYSFYDDLMYSGKKTMHNLVEEVAKTRQQIERISNGQGEMRVIAEGYGAHKNRMDRRYAEVCKKAESTEGQQTE